MPKEIALPYGVSGVTTLYAAIRRPSDGQRWYTVTPAFEAYNAAHVAAGYAVALTEEGTAGNYYADFPAGIAAAGTYEVVVRRQVGGSPAWPADPVVATGAVEWTGSAVAVPVAADASGRAPLLPAESLIHRTGTAQAGGSATITLDSGASAADLSYVGHTIAIISGTGSPATRQITGYVGSTKVATVNRPWTTAPDSTSVFSVFRLLNAVLDANLAVTAGTVADKSGYALTSAYDAAKAAATFPTDYARNNVAPSWSIAAASIWDLATSGHATSGTFGAAVIAAGSAGDPWATAIPGSYAAGTAGAILGSQVDYTASAATSTSITLAATDPRKGTSQVGKRVLITGGSAGAGQVGVVTASNTTTGVQTVAGGWDESVTPTGTITYDLLPAAASGGSIGSTAPTGWINAAAFATDAISAASVSSGAVAKIGASGGSGTAQTGDVFGLLNPLIASGAFTGAALANVPRSGYLLAAAGLDAVPVESGMNARQALSPMAAFAGGVLSGAGSGTITIKGAGVSTTRIVAVTDSSGNRSAITLTLPT